MPMKWPRTSLPAGSGKKVDTKVVPISMNTDIPHGGGPGMWKKKSTGRSKAWFQKFNLPDYQLLAISGQLSAISYQLSAISYQLSAISCVGVREVGFGCEDRKG